MTNASSESYSLNGATKYYALNAFQGKLNAVLR